MRFVNDWGQLVRMSERNYRRYLKDGAAGKFPTASQYGKTIGLIDLHTIDAKPQEFQDALDMLNRTAKNDAT